MKDHYFEMGLGGVYLCKIKRSTLVKGPLWDNGIHSIVNVNVGSNHRYTNLGLWRYLTKFTIS